MISVMDGRALEELRALEVEETELAERAERLQHAIDAIAATRARAEEIAAFFDSYDDEEEGRRAEITAAEGEVHRRQAEVTAAEADAAAARDDETRAQAARAVARAADHLSVAALRLGHARADLESLARTARDFEGEVPELEARAAAIAGAEGLAEPHRGLEQLVDWASQARAELFVAAGQVSAQRERVVREANELASMLLGEPAYGLTVAQALRQVEANSGRNSALGAN